VSLFLIYKNL